MNAIPLDDGDKRRLILRLVTQLRCLECGHPYDPTDFTVVHRRQDMWVLGTRCRHCENTCHVVIFMNQDAGPEPVVDLTPEEMDLAAEWPPITADDVLNMHDFLQEFDGDFVEFFAD